MDQMKIVKLRADSCYLCTKNATAFVEPYDDNIHEVKMHFIDQASYLMKKQPQKCKHKKKTKAEDAD